MKKQHITLSMMLLASSSNLFCMFSGLGSKANFAQASVSKPNPTPKTPTAPLSLGRRTTKPWQKTLTPQQKAQFNRSADSILVLAPDTTIVSTTDGITMSNKSDQIVGIGGNTNIAPQSAAQGMSIGKSALEPIALMGTRPNFAKSAYNSTANAIGAAGTNISSVAKYASDAARQAGTKLYNSLPTFRSNKVVLDDQVGMQFGDEQLQESLTDSSQALVPYDPEFARTQQGSTLYNAKVALADAGRALYNAPGKLSQALGGTEKIGTALYNAPGKAVASLGGNQQFITDQTGSLSSAARSASTAASQAGKNLYNSATAAGTKLYNSLPTFRSNKVAPDLDVDSLIYDSYSSNSDEIPLLPTQYQSKARGANRTSLSRVPSTSSSLGDFDFVETPTTTSSYDV